LLLLLLLQDFLRTGCDLEVSLKDLRLLLPTLSLDAAAIAGQAVALSQWHQVMHSSATRGRCRRLMAEDLLAVLQPSCGTEHRSATLHGGCFTAAAAAPPPAVTDAMAMQLIMRRLAASRCSDLCIDSNTSCTYACPRYAACREQQQSAAAVLHTSATAAS
jgi:hypothetical protein